MRGVAFVLIVTLTGCSFLMSSKRLKEAPAEGQAPVCDTNDVVPLVDLLVGVSAAAIGLGTVFGEGSLSDRTEYAAIGAIGVAYIAGWWYGRKWHNECRDAKRAYEEQSSSGSSADDW